MRHDRPDHRLTVKPVPLNERDTAVNHRDSSSDDDLDHLLSDPLTPPPDLAPRILRRAGIVRRSRRLWFALASELAALAVLAALALLLGRALVSGDSGALLTFVLNDLSAVRGQPDVFVVALADAIPWRLVFALAVDLLAVVLLTGYLLRASTPGWEGMESRGP